MCSRAQPPPGTPLDVERMRQVRALFDALCERPASEWQAALDDPVLDPAVAAETRDLLAAQQDPHDPLQRHVARMLTLAQDAELGPQDVLGPWRLLEEIGAGGMGKVFLAERADGLYRRHVAIKLLKGVADPAHAERLQFERQVLAGLRLPNVARLYDGGTTPGGQPYLVMEYVAGMPLDAYCDRHDLPLAARLALFLQVCDSVSAAHGQLVVHCDLKPANVLVGADGVPVLLDFGVARLLGEASANPGLRMYTPVYAAPELVDKGQASVRTDVFSLGVILLELLAARPVDRNRPAPELPSPSTWTRRGADWQRHLQGDLDAIVATACAPAPGDRYPTVEALAADIRRGLAHYPVKAREGERGYVARRFMRRNWQGLGLAAVAVVVIAGFIVGLVDARRVAEQEARSASAISRYLVGMFESTDPRQRGEDAEHPLTARELLDNASKQVSADLQDAPMQRARLQAALGQAYQNLGVRGPATQLLHEAASTLGSSPARTDAEEAARLHALLALEQSESGDGTTAAATVARGNAFLGSRPAPRARAWLAYALGVARINTQDFPAAETALDEALDHLQPLHEEEAEEAAYLRFRIEYRQALLNWRRGQPVEAERLYRGLLARTPPSQTSLVHELETRLGQVLRAQSRMPEARSLLEDGLERARALYGPDSRFLLLQHEALADLYWDMGDLRAADDAFQGMYALVHTVDGRDGLRESQTLHNHAQLLAIRGDRATAERLFRQAWGIRSRELGRDSTMAMRAEIGLAHFLIGEGRLSEARPLLAHAGEGLTRLLPASAPALGEVAMAHIDLHLQEGDTAAARALFDRTRPHAGPPQERLRWMEQDLRIARAEADHARLQRISVEGLALARHALGEASIETARWHLHRAKVLATQGQHAAAARLLAPVLPVIRTQLLETAAERLEAEQLAELPAPGHR